MVYTESFNLFIEFLKFHLVFATFFWELGEFRIDKFNVISNARSSPYFAKVLFSRNSREMCLCLIALIAFAKYWKRLSISKVPSSVRQTARFCEVQREKNQPLHVAYRIGHFFPEAILNSLQFWTPNDWLSSKLWFSVRPTNRIMLEREIHAHLVSFQVTGSGAIFVFAALHFINLLCAEAKS